MENSREQTSLEEAKKRIRALRDRDLSLDLWNLGLTSEDLETIFLDPGLNAKLLNLTVLDLSGNDITIIPAGIGNLVKLSQLIFANNQIATIPAEIEKLTNLEVMDLSQNQIATIPVGIGKLVKLKLLSFANNNITGSIPEGIFILPYLVTLSLGNNQIPTIESSVIKKLRNDYGLRHMEIDNTGLLDQRMLDALIEMRIRFSEQRERLGQAGIHDADHRYYRYYYEYSNILNQTDYKDDQAIKKLFKENNKLQEFLSKTSPLTKDRIEALNYLLGKKLLIEGEAATYKAAMETQTGDCGTPVKDFLTKMLLAQYKEDNREVPEGLEEKIAIGEYLDKNLKKSGISGITDSEAIEYKQGLLNALFLKGSEDNIGNKYLRIVRKPYYRDSDTNYSLYPQQKEFALKFAKIFCKTDEDGNLKIENGCYLADKEKIDEITDLYRINTRVKELKIPSMNKASEIVKAVVEKLYNKLEELPDGFDTADENILIVNKAIKEMVKQDPKIAIENITAGSVVGYFSKAKQHPGDTTPVPEDLEVPKNIVSQRTKGCKELFSLLWSKLSKTLCREVELR